VLQTYETFPFSRLPSLSVQDKEKLRLAVEQTRMLWKEASIGQQQLSSVVITKRRVGKSSRQMANRYPYEQMGNNGNELLGRRWWRSLTYGTKIAVGVGAAFALCVVVSLFNGTSPPLSGDDMSLVNNARKREKLLAGYVPNFQGHVIIGHSPAPDMDSVGCAIGIASLYGGTPAAPGPINAQTQYVLDHFNVRIAHLRDIPAAAKEKCVVVDFNSASQISPALDADCVRGVFDHHTLSSHPVSLRVPTPVTIQPVGSCCTIATHLFADKGKTIPKDVAGPLLGGILSDTLGLRGPTTTDVDRDAVALLRKRLGLSARHVQTIALKMFQASASKTQSDAPIAELALIDFKRYELPYASTGETKVVGWGTIETVEPYYDQLCARLASANDALIRVKKEKALDFMFLSIVDVLNQKSCITSTDKRIMGRMLPSYSHAAGVWVTDLVSRKKQFMPKVREVIAEA